MIARFTRFFGYISNVLLLTVTLNTPPWIMEPEKTDFVVSWPLVVICEAVLTEPRGASIDDDGRQSLVLDRSDDKVYF